MLPTLAPPSNWYARSEAMPGSSMLVGSWRFVPPPEELGTYLHDHGEGSKQEVHAHVAVVFLGNLTRGMHGRKSKENRTNKKTKERDRMPGLDSRKGPHARRGDKRHARIKASCTHS